MNPARPRTSEAARLLLAVAGWGIDSTRDKPKRPSDLSIVPEFVRLVSKHRLEPIFDLWLNTVKNEAASDPSEFTVLTEAANATRMRNKVLLREADTLCRALHSAR